MTYPDCTHVIGGQPVAGGPRFMDVHNPADGSRLGRVPLGDAATVDRAIQAAEAAFPAWSTLPIKERKTDRRTQSTQKRAAQEDILSRTLSTGGKK